MQEIRRLVFRDFEPVGDYHAALIDASRSARSSGLHTHDFHEFFYIINGNLVHVLPDRTEVVSAGDLVFLHPTDAHELLSKRGSAASGVNIAFASEVWEEFCAVTGAGRESMLNRPLGRSLVNVPMERRMECRSAFERALYAYHEHPTRVEIYRFWCAVTEMFSGREEPAYEAAAGMPAWLAATCARMRQPDNLVLGVVRMVELSEVSHEHLARTLRAHAGKTPTEWVNDLRLKRAALLLTTTPDEIVVIASECGFENLSHFYRLFGKRYGQTPRGYRMAGQRVARP